MDSINPRNYIIQTVLDSVNGYEIKPMNNYKEFDGFYLDIEEIKRNKYRFRIRQDFLKDIVNITFDSNAFVIKYSTDFYISSTKINPNKEVQYKSNLISGNFVKDDLHKIIGTEINYEIDCDALILALAHCEKIYNEIKQIKYD